MADSRDQVTLRGRPGSPVQEPAAPAAPERSSSTEEHPTPPTDLIGKQWASRYVIESFLAAGGMGEVWRASSEDVPRLPVVVKIISEEYGHSREAIERLFREARAIAALDDPNVVQLVDTGRLPDGRPCLIMEYVDGPSIQELVEKEGPQPLERVCKHMMQAGSAAHAVHSAGIVHRDIKPANLLVTTKWRRADFVKLLDLGIAKPADPELAGKMRTRTKALVGTAGYMAPEQALARAIDAKADVYSLGVVLFVELTGRTPYQTETYIEMIGQQINSAPFPAPIELRPDTPPEWNQLCLDCLQFDPTKRPTVVEFVNRIASGWPEGKALMRVLAPGIAVLRGPSTPHAATMPGDVATAFTRLSAVFSVPELEKRRFRSAIALVAAALLGSLVTFFIMYFASSTSTEPPPTETAAPSTPPIPIGSAAVVAPATPPDASPSSGSATTNTGTTNATAAPPDAGTTSPTQPRPTESPPDRASTPDRPNPVQPRKPAAAVTSKTLTIRALPVAQVEIDGVFVGETPPTIRKVLTPGTHRIRLTGPDKQVRDLTRTVDERPLAPIFERFKTPGELENK